MKNIKIPIVIPIIIIAIPLIVVALYFQYMAKTIYTGYVSIEKTSITGIKTKLEEQGCRSIFTYKEGELSTCSYEEKKVPYESNPGLRISAWKSIESGGTETIQFYLTEDKLWIIEEDISGFPTAGKFKKRVREGLKDIGNIVQIQEKAWKITNIQYETVFY